jgi:uncharacterized protein (DUF4415 family)
MPRKPPDLPEPIIDDENPEWTEEDFARAVGPKDMPPELLAFFPNTPRPRGPQKEPTKRPVTLRVDPDVLEHYRATGPGWQSRMNAVLREGMVAYHGVAEEMAVKIEKGDGEK